MCRPLGTYEQVIEFLFGRINYERIDAGSYSARDFKLDRMRKFLALLGNPQQRIPAVHIAGTKGKGSTAVMVAAMLTAAGYRTGLFTSPHLSAFEERMTIGGLAPEPDVVVSLVNRLLPIIEELDQSPQMMSPTFFEIATAMAWLHFAEQDAQIAVMEVGVGGRLDSTNVCCPEVSLITNIGRDHTALLGNTPAQIAREKAGIIKEGVPVVSGVVNEEARHVVEEVCQKNGSKLLQLGRGLSFEHGQANDPHHSNQSDRTGSGNTVDVKTPLRSWPAVPVPLLGVHQSANAALAIAAVETLQQRGWRIPPDAVYSGMQQVRWPLRIEVLRTEPTVVVDAAHNQDSVEALLMTLKTEFPENRRILIFAATRDKDVQSLLQLLLPEFETVILTQYLNNPRAVSIGQLEELAESISAKPVQTADKPSLAWSLAERLADDDDLICVTGSFFVAAEMRELILNQQGRARDCVDRPNGKSATTEATNTLAVD